ncbi:hypothetical protein EDD40_0788 [Saccharothrix texasensis]|uniref:Uncharacterized protein n=1 Tax=Saccharothrix texasensis TaxID=103734 RepID=A0A3N1GZL5_9PSEU|nr:hypothetical protein EDD40_0788 [Saccharothrix texasensis]
MARAHAVPALSTWTTEPTTHRCATSESRANTLLLSKQPWHALQHATINPSRIGTITKTALVPDNAGH